MKPTLAKVVVLPCHKQIGVTTVLLSIVYTGAFTLAAYHLGLKFMTQNIIIRLLTINE